MTLHSALTGAELHEPKGVAAATSGQVYVANGAGSGTWTTIDSTLPSNIVKVESADDLPAAVSNVRTLLPNTAYQIVGSVPIGDDRLVTGTNTVIFGLNKSLDSLSTTSTSPMITTTNNNLVMKDISLSSTAGDIFAFTGSGVENISLLNVNINNCTDYAVISDVLSMTMTSCVWGTSTADGIQLSGTCGTFNMQRCEFSSFVGIALDFGTSTWDQIVIRNTKFDVDASQTGISAAASNANFTATGLGFINESIFVGAGTLTSNITSEDTRWIDRDNIGLVPVDIFASGNITGNATATTFSGTGSGNEVVVNFGTGFNDNKSPGFTISNAGRVTQDALRTRECLVTIPISASISGGAARTYNFYIAKNGTIDTATINVRTFDGTNKGSLTVVGVIELATTDYIELYARAETATTSLTVDTCHIVVTPVV
jgi:hypothetical protein